MIVPLNYVELLEVRRIAASLWSKGSAATYHSRYSFVAYSETLQSLPRPLITTSEA